MTHKKFYICTPGASQSVAIARMLRKYYSNSYLVGVLLPGEQKRPNKFFDHYCPIEEIDIDTPIIPTGAFSTKFLLEQRNVNIGKVILNKETLRVCNKPWIIDQAKEIGIPTPTTWYTVNDISSFPIFYKQRYEKGGGERGVAQKLEDIPMGEREHLIFQELIDSQGTYGVSFLAKNGEILASYTHYERESYPKSGGSAIVIEEFKDECLAEYTKRILKSLNYSGWGLAEFKFCPKREDFVFMEINAKFWASCEFAFRNEPLFLKLLFDIQSNEKSIKRMVFLDRAFSRGVFFAFFLFSKYIFNSKFRVYPGWERRFLSSFLPSSFRGFLKKNLTQGKMG